MTTPPGMGPGRAIKALGHSMDGLASAWRTEGSFRLEVVAAAVLIPAALLVPVSGMERVLMIGSVMLVLIVELLNSSVECAIDRISTEHHPLSKRAKDIGSAAVFLSLLLALMVWAAALGNSLFS